MEAKSKMEFNPAGNEEAGMTVIQNDRSAYVMSLMDGKIQLHHFFHGTDSLLASHSYKKSTVFWNISADYLDYDFSYSQDGKNWVLLFNNADGSAAWDGNFQGSPQPREVYIYVLTFQRRTDATAITIRGQVTLLR